MSYDQYYPGDGLKAIMNAVLYSLPKTVEINGLIANTETTIKNLYVVGIDADNRSMGITRAVYSVVKLIKVLSIEKVNKMWLMLVWIYIAAAIYILLRMLKLSPSLTTSYDLSEGARHLWLIGVLVFLILRWYYNKRGEA